VDAPGPPLIALEAIARTYGRGEAMVHALRGVDLEIRRGEFVAITGPSGCGKSTLMHILGCLDTPSSGHYRFRGIEVGTLSGDQRALMRRYVLAFVFQTFNLLPRTSALENVELPLLYRGLPAPDRRRAAARALGAVGLEGRERHTPGELSGGQQQRVAIARALVAEPEVILADEPTGNLDTERSHEILDLLCGLNQDRGITVVMVTHEPEAAARARRVVSFLDGAMVSDVHA
jgi:putative ABC transport system ATP-binding protein